MKKFVNVIIGIVLLIMGIMNYILVRDLEQKTLELIELTDVEPEIVFLESIKYDTVFVERKEVVKLPIVDTLVLADTVVAVAVDSVYVELPIELKHFSDTLSNIAISFDLLGYNCEVKDLYIENFLKQPTQEKAVKRWYDNIHLGAGLGVTYVDRLRVVPTLGIYYKLF